MREPKEPATMLIDRAYTRLEAELTLHWSRINVSWLIVIAVFTAHGYLVYQCSGLGEDGDVNVNGSLIGIMLAASAGLALIAATAWKSIIDSGNSWIQLWEQKIGVLESFSNQDLYLLVNQIHTVDTIQEEYANRYGFRAKEYPSVTIAYQYLSRVAMVFGLAALIVCVFFTNVYGDKVEHTPAMYGIFIFSVIVTILIEWPMSVIIRNKTRVLSEEVIQKLKDISQ